MSKVNVIQGNAMCKHGMHRVATIRENQGIFGPSGKSGNFNIFCRESGKVRENDLAEMTQSLSLISGHIFIKTQVVEGAKFFLASLGISRDTHQICVVRSGKVGEKCTKKVRESQGIPIELTGSNPGCT